MAFGVVVMTLPGVAAAGTVMINTDSTVGGSSASSAPPLPQATNRAPAATSQPTQREGTRAAPSQSNDLEWVRVGADGSTQREKASVGTRAAASNATSDNAQRSAPPLPARPTAASGGGDSRSQPTRSSTPQRQQRWELEPGLLKDQLVSWGKKDPVWDVIWEGSKDIEIEVSHDFYGDLDETVISVVKALAHNGTPIRLKRAKANHKLIVRSGK